MCGTELIDIIKTLFHFTILSLAFSLPTILPICFLSLPY